MLFNFCWCHMCKIMFVFCQNMICWPILAQLQILHKLLNLGFFCLKTITYTPKPIPNSHPHFPKVMSSLPLPNIFPPIFSTTSGSSFHINGLVLIIQILKVASPAEWTPEIFRSVVDFWKRRAGYLKWWALEKVTDSFLNMAILSIYAKFLGWGVD